MPTNGTLNPQGTGDNAKLVYSYAIAEAGDHVLTLNTKNTFVDKNIEINAPIDAAGALTLNIVDKTAAIDMGEASEGYYNPAVALSGNVDVASAGWITDGNHSVSEASVVVGKVAQSTLKNGATAISSGDAIIPQKTTDQTVNISEGYNDARTVVVKSQSAGDKATVTSANATITSVSYTENGNQFNIAGSQSIAAPTVNADGYISSTLGTRNGGTANVATTVDKVTVGASTDKANLTVTPVIARTEKASTDSFVDAASGAASTTKPTSGAHIQVDVAAIADSTTVTPAVTAAGYGTASAFQSAGNVTITAGSNAAATAYIPVKTGTVAANGATITSVTPSYNSDSGKFDITGSANIPAPTVSAAGYVGDGVGSVSGLNNGAEVDAELNKIAIGATVDDSAVVTPVIAKNAATNIDAGAATTTQPSGGKYIAVATAATTAAVSATAAVTSAGYGTANEGEYTATSDSGAITINASAVTYIPVTEATFANTAAAGHTYGDVSADAPVLISGDYLYINKGYTDDVKISLAKLVPDQANITVATGAANILSGTSAYDKDGTLIAGTIPTYTGAYTVA